MNRTPMVGQIERRLLVNYRVDPEVLDRILPDPFRPQLVHDMGLAGICLIRLGHLRPHRLPAWVGRTSENAAHRIAVEWDGPDGRQCGVYVPRRHTSSPLNAFVGGRLFPGAHHRASFVVTEGAGRYSVSLESLDRRTRVVLDAEVAPDLGPGSVFGSVAEASAFFESAPMGYSPARGNDRYEGIALRCSRWQLEPLAVVEVHSSFFDDSTSFPPGTTEFDSALLMRGVPAIWEPREPFAAGAECVVG